MVVGFFIDETYPTCGGCTRSVQLQVADLQAHGHTAVVFCPYTSQDLPEVYKLPAYRPFGFEGSIKANAKIVTDITKKFKFDIIHSQTERGALLLAHRVAQAQGVPHVHTFHTNYTFMRPYYRLLFPFLMLGTDYFVKYVLKAPHIAMPTQLSHHYKRYQWLTRAYWQDLAMIAGIVNHYTTPMPFNLTSLEQLAPHANGTLTPTGVDTHIFSSAKRQRPANAPVRVALFGRVSREKRVLTALKAFLLAADELPELELTVIGDGNELAHIRRAVARSRHATRISVVGAINDRQRLAQALADADISLMASYHFDTQAMVLLEAAAAGLPIVYCDERLTVGVSPQNAVLTKPDTASLAAGIMALATDPNKRLAMREASLHLAQHFSREALQWQYIEIYDKLLANHDARST